jgi:hypothetical protein
MSTAFSAKPKNLSWSTFGVPAIRKTDANIKWFANNCGESVCIVKVDVDKDTELYDRFGIPRVGTVLFFLSGEFRLSLQASTPATLLLQTLRD